MPDWHLQIKILFICSLRLIYRNTPGLKKAGNCILLSLVTIVFCCLCVCQFCFLQVLSTGNSLKSKIRCRRKVGWLKCGFTSTETVCFIRDGSPGRPPLCNNNP